MRKGVADPSNQSTIIGKIKDMRPANKNISKEPLATCFGYTI